MDDKEIERLLEEVHQAENEMRILMNGMSEEDKRTFLADMDDAKYERWD